MYDEANHSLLLLPRQSNAISYLRAPCCSLERIVANEFCYVACIIAENAPDVSEPIQKVCPMVFSNDFSPAFADHLVRIA